MRTLPCAQPVSTNMLLFFLGQMLPVCWDVDVFVAGIAYCAAPCSGRQGYTHPACAEFWTQLAVDIELTVSVHVQVGAGGQRRAGGPAAAAHHQQRPGRRAQRAPTHDGPPDQLRHHAVSSVPSACLSGCLPARLPSVHRFWCLQVLPLVVCTLLPTAWTCIIHKMSAWPAAAGMQSTPR
jgi:hypothetical protein